MFTRRHESQSKYIYLDYQKNVIIFFNLINDCLHSRQKRLKVGEQIIFFYGTGGEASERIWQGAGVAPSHIDRGDNMALL